MVDLIKPSELAPAASVDTDAALVVDNAGQVLKATPEQVVDAGAPVPTQAEAIAGTDNTKRMTPLTTRQVLDNEVAPSVLRAQAWAESATAPDPLLPDSKSSKTWAGIAQAAGEIVSITSGAGFPTRADFAVAISTGALDGLSDGQVVSAAGLQYVKKVGSTVIPDLSNWEPSDRASPGHMGAVGDGVVDDTLSLERLIACGIPVSWGDGTKRYRTTSMIDLEIDHRIDWVSSGAEIVCDFASPNAAMIKLTVLNHLHNIDGVLWFSCEKKVRRGLYLLHTSAPDQNGPDIDMSGYVCTDPYLTVTTDSCEGLLVEGGWRNVTLNNPIVLRSTRAVGAGLFGSYGAFGISVLRIGSTSDVTPMNVLINAPYIDTVVSDDPAEGTDQDGIRVLLAARNNSPIATESVYIIKDGYFRNCRNRSIKGQAGMGIVNDCTFIRDTDLGASVDKGSSPEIDEQIGSLSSSGCRFIYNGFIPTFLYTAGRFHYDITVKPGSSIRDIRVQVSGYSGNQLDLFAFTNDTGETSNHIATIDSVQVVGAPVRRILTIQAALAGPLCVYNVSRVSYEAIPTGSAVVQNSGSPALGLAKINIDKVVNRSPTYTSIAYAGAGGAGVSVSVSGSVGVVGTGFGNPPSGQYPASTAMKAFHADMGNGGRYGMVRVLSYDLASGESAQLPQGSFSINAGLLLIGVGVGLGTHQVIIGGGGAPVLMTPESTGWVVGTTSEPAGSNVFKFWAGASGGVIKNDTATARVFTVLMVG